MNCFGNDNYLVKYIYIYTYTHIYLALIQNVICKVTSKLKS